MLIFFRVDSAGGLGRRLVAVLGSRHWHWHWHRHHPRPGPIPGSRARPARHRHDRHPMPKATAWSPAAWSPAARSPAAWSGGWAALRSGGGSVGGGSVPVPVRGRGFRGGICGAREDGGGSGSAPAGIPRGRVLTVLMNGGRKSFRFRPLRVPGAPGARAGPGRVRGRRPWASGGGGVTGGSVTGGLVWRRCGRVAARWVAARSRSRSVGADSGAGFAARARTWGVCGCFYEGAAVADDPVARRRPASRAGEC